MTIISVTLSTGKITSLPPLISCTVLDFAGSEVDCGVWGCVVDSSGCFNGVLSIFTGYGTIATGIRVSSRSKMNLSSSNPLIACVFYLDLAPIVPGARNGLPQYGLFN